MREKNITSKRLSKSQALLELGVFGSILIMLLGVLVSYGLRYNFQQETTMNAFRRALAAAHNTPDDDYPYSVSIVERDYRHIPDASDPFGVGGVSLSTAAYTVTRNHKLNETADNYKELSETRYIINGDPVSSAEGGSGFKTAGFFSVGGGNKKRYRLAFGGKEKDGRIISSTSGNIFSYDTAKQVCLILIDNDICKRTCKEEDGEDCSDICNKPVSRLPWFCRGYSVKGTGINTVYTFPQLDNLFAFSQTKTKDRSLGMQPGYTQESHIHNSLLKEETKDSTVTESNIEWEVINSNPVYYLPMHKGSSDVSREPVQEEARESVSQNRQEKWKTSF